MHQKAERPTERAVPVLHPPRFLPSFAGVLLAFAASGFPALAADLTVRQITEQLYLADTVASPVDFSGRDLGGLDLAGLAFKKARLSKTDLFGADLSGADLSGSDLTTARLDRTLIIRTRFDDAQLSGASLLRPNTRSGFDYTPGEAPSFARADLSHAKLFGLFNGSDFSGAKLTGASLAPFGHTGFIEMQWRTRLDGANLSGADLSDADLTHVSLRFANLKGANLRGAMLKHADLAHADLTDADLTGADLSNADLYSAKLTHAKGLASVGGLGTVRNRDKAVP